MPALHSRPRKLPHTKNTERVLIRFKTSTLEELEIIFPRHHRSDIVRQIVEWYLKDKVQNFLATELEGER